MASYFGWNHRAKGRHQKQINNEKLKVGHNSVVSFAYVPAYKIVNLSSVHYKKYQYYETTEVFKKQ